MTCPVTISTDPLALAQRVKEARVIALDTETSQLDYRRVQMVGFSAFVPGDTTGFYIPTYSEVEWEGLVDLDVAKTILRSILDDPDKTAILHNAQFDLLVFRKLGISCRCRIFDTLLAARACDNTYFDIYETRKNGHGNAIGTLNYKLKTLSAYLLVGSQQQSFQDATRGFPAPKVEIRRMAPYAVSDVYYTARLYQVLVEKLEPSELRVLEELDFPMIPIIVEMMFGGIPVDVATARFWRDDTERKLKRVTKAITQLLGRPANLGDKGVLRDILVNDCGIPKAAQYRSLSKNALQTLVGMAKDRKRFARRFVKLVIYRRKQAQLLNSFLKPLIARTNEGTGTLYIKSFKCETATWRYTAHGPNMMALPSAKAAPIRRVIRAPQGFKVVAIDFSQIEPRVLAQALLMFMEDKDRPIQAEQNRNRANSKARFGGLLKTRVWLRKYRPDPKRVYPERSALADFFMEHPDADLYLHMAREISKGSENLDMEKRPKDVKRAFLAPLYGQSPYGLSASLKIDVDEAKTLLTRMSEILPEIGITRYSPDGTRVADHDPNAEVQHPNFKTQTEWLARHTGEATSLFGRKRRFAGLYQLRNCTNATVRCYLGKRLWEFDTLTLQLWNWALHTHINKVTDYKTQQVIATTADRGDHEILSTYGTCAWPFRNLSYKSIRTLTVGTSIVNFIPIAEVHRQAVNSIIQISAGDVFKKSMIRVDEVARLHGAKMILNVHDEVVCLVPDGNLDAFIRDAVMAMQQPPADWWKIPIRVKAEVGQNYGQMRPYKPPTRARVLPTKRARARARVGALLSWIKSWISRVSRWLRVNRFRNPNP